MCLYPKLIRNPKYKPNKKNNYTNILLKDQRVATVPIGCGNCMECIKKKQREWQVRLLEEIKNYKDYTFITLTFSNESISNLSKLTQLKGYQRDNAIATIAIRRFLERWRKQTKKSLRHWFTTELGHNGTENIHLHGIIKSRNRELIEKTWQYGYIWPRYNKDMQNNYVSAKTINYITKYISKRDLQHSEYKPIILCSKGIGQNYTNSLNAQLNKFNSKKKQTKHTQHKRDTK